MHPLEKHYHHQHPEYLNHIMMRFGHHLSVHQQQTFSTQFSGGMSSSCQGSRIQKKLSSVTAQQQQQRRQQQHHYPYYRNQITSSVFPFKKPVVHMSKTSIPQQQQQRQRLLMNGKDEEGKKAIYSPITIQRDVTMKETTSLSTDSSNSSSGADSITMTTTRNNTINSINARDNKVKKLSTSPEKDKKL